MNLEPDTPISRLSDDRFGRKRLARFVANQIESLPTGTAFTIAVTGPWGSGKTSFVQMLEDALAGSGDLAIIHFNPWYFSGVPELAQRFYIEVGQATESQEGIDLRAVGQALLAVGESLSPLIPEPHYNVILKIFRWILRSRARPISLENSHDQLRRALAASGKRLIVTVDDIDRLTGDEVREVLRFVRMTGALPNVTFILAYDAQRVAAQLGKDDYGEPYLEKIVQLTVDLPLIREQRLRTDFLEALEESIPDRLKGGIGTHWSEHFHTHIKPLLRSSRDVKRVINALRISVDLLGDEVDLADLITLETLRVMRPGLFASLRGAGVAALTSTSNRYATGDADPAVIQARLDRLISTAGDEGQFVQTLLRRLFPTTDNFFGRNIEPSQSWRRERRVAAAQVLAIYFHGGADSGEIGTREVRRALAALPMPDEFNALVEDLSERELVDLFERLEDYEYSYPDGAEASIPVVFQQMSRLSPESRGFFEFSDRLRADRVIYRLLRGVGQERTDAVVTNTFRNLSNLSQQLHLVEMVGSDDGRNDMVGTAQLTELKQSIQRSLQERSTEQLAQEWGLVGLVLRATRWEQKVPPETLQKWCSDAPFVAAVVLKAIGRARFGDGRCQAQLPWEAFETTFGSEAWVAAVTRSEVLDLLPGNVTYLLAKYVGGWEPQHFEHDPALSF